FLDDQLQNLAHGRFDRRAAQIEERLLVLVDDLDQKPVVGDLDRNLIDQPDQLLHARKPLGQMGAQDFEGGRLNDAGAELVHAAVGNHAGGAAENSRLAKI